MHLDSLYLSLFVLHSSTWSSASSMLEPNSFTSYYFVCNMKIFYYSLKCMNISNFCLDLAFLSQDISLRAVIVILIFIAFHVCDVKYLF
jgi:hypothetical protein